MEAMGTPAPHFSLQFTAWLGQQESQMSCFFFLFLITLKHPLEVHLSGLAHLKTKPQETSFILYQFNLDNSFY